MSSDIVQRIERDVPLAPLTNISLGGLARALLRCESEDDIRNALIYAEEQNLQTHVLAGGSNTIFADSGFSGLVIVVNLKGVDFSENRAIVAAGEPWDEVVKQSVGMNLAGIEALSGIPGSTGATPIQNVGAYGQEVSDTVRCVKAIDRNTGAIKTFSNKECRFSYRTSRFKEEDKDAYIITEVEFELQSGAAPHVRYQQLQQELGEEPYTLSAVRAAVLKLRRNKSMIIDPKDPNSRSCGSFFLNPILSKDKLVALQQDDPEIPFFEWKNGNVKIPAAYIIEKAGFTKGMRRNGVGISQNHTLALVNYGGSTSALLELAHEIQQKVLDAFGIPLAYEPVIVSSTHMRR